jgi:hypothetical protein
MCADVSPPMIRTSQSHILLHLIFAMYSTYMFVSMIIWVDAFKGKCVHGSCVRFPGKVVPVSLWFLHYNFVAVLYAATVGVVAGPSNMFQKYYL